MEAVSAPILDHMAALADPIRVRMLLPLEGHELTVSELCAVLQLPQSTVSRHLKTLADGGWVSSRRDGTSRFYSMALDALDAGARQLWPVIRAQMGASAGADQDERRLQAVLQLRREKSREFFSSASGEWDRLRRELFGAGSALHALPALVDSRWTIGDLGCGTGETSAALAPFVERVVAVDRSEEMLQAARRRLRDLPNVRSAAAIDVRRGELEALPIAGGELDAAVMMLVLHHVPDPGAVLQEAARTLKPRGRFVLCDMLPHDHEEYKQQMGHVWLGFGDDQLRRLLGAAGFDDIRIVPLPPDPGAKGPALFVASAVRG